MALMTLRPLSDHLVWTSVLIQVPDQISPQIPTETVDWAQLSCGICSQTVVEQSVYSDTNVWSSCDSKRVTYLHFKSSCDLIATSEIQSALISYVEIQDPSIQLKPCGGM